MLLNKVIAAHGGQERWNKVASVFIYGDVKANILATRLNAPRTYSLKIEVNTQKVECIISPFPKAGQRGIFTNEYVQIEKDDGTPVIKKSIQELFNGKTQLPFIWQDVNILYFFGYAFWNYFTTPYLFSWPGFQIEEIGTWQEQNGETWQKLAVKFPNGVPTHCQKQTFYFNEAGLLCRLDYTAEIFSPFAYGAHYCWQHKEFDGFIFPTRRKVFWRMPSGHPLKLLGVMEGWINKVVINWKKSI